MTTNPEKPGKPLLARIISLEGAMAAFGLYSLISGLLNEEALQIFWGIMILGGLCLLIAIRRRDWKKHWEEMDAISAARLQASSRESDDTNQTEK